MAASPWRETAATCTTDCVAPGVAADDGADGLAIGAGFATTFVGSTTVEEALGAGATGFVVGEEADSSVESGLAEPLSGLAESLSEEDVREAGLASGIPDAGLELLEVTASVTGAGTLEAGVERLPRE